MEDGILVEKRRRREGSTDGGIERMKCQKNREVSSEGVNERGREVLRK